jgi:hypothetical protein
MHTRKLEDAVKISTLLSEVGTGSLAPHSTGAVHEHVFSSELTFVLVEPRRQV